MSLKRNYVVKTGSSIVVSGEMKSLNLIDEIQYNIDFNPLSGSVDFRQIASLKLWLIDAKTGDLFPVDAEDVNIYNGTELIPGSWASSNNGYYEVTNGSGEARIFLSETDGKYRIVVPPLSIPASDYVTRQGSKPLVLHVEYTTQDETKGTYQIPMTLQQVGRTAYSGTL